MTIECILVGGKHDGKVLVITNICKTIEVPILLDGGFGVIRYIKQDEKIDGKTVYRLENDKVEAL